jgi:hypothetical protein
MRSVGMSRRPRPGEHLTPAGCGPRGPAGRRYIVTPVWWWAVPHPHENYVALNLGIYTVTSTGLALVTSAIGLVLLPLAIALNRHIASVHARLARRALED